MQANKKKPQTTLTKNHSKTEIIFSRVSLLQSSNIIQYFMSSVLKVLLHFLLQKVIALSRRKSSGLSCEMTQGKSELLGFPVKI